MSFKTVERETIITTVVTPQPEWTSISTREGCDDVDGDVASLASKPANRDLTELRVGCSCSF